MDINLNPQVDKIAKVVTGQVKPREVAPPKEEVELSESRALEKNLRPLQRKSESVRITFFGKFFWEIYGQEVI